eukprot:1362899-Prymnesium_polylepis.1
MTGQAGPLRPLGSSHPGWKGLVAPPASRPRGRQQAAGGPHGRRGDGRCEYSKRYATVALGVKNTTSRSRITNSDLARLVSALGACGATQKWQLVVTTR